MSHWGCSVCLNRSVPCWGPVTQGSQGACLCKGLCYVQCYAVCNTCHCPMSTRLYAM